MSKKTLLRILLLLILSGALGAPRLAKADGPTTKPACYPSPCLIN